MRYKTLGGTGLKVSEMCLGTWGIGGAGWDAYSDETRLDAIHAALEQGVNFIDTAPGYNGGAAERLVGRAVKDMGARGDVYIATKCGTEYIDGQYVRFGAEKDILRECDESLRNLQTDYIDLYLVHWPNLNFPFSETMGALEKLKQQGKVLHVGVCNFTREQMEQAAQYCPIEVYQAQHSMVYRDNEAQMQWAASHGMGVMAYGALGGGILTGAIREARTYAPSDSRNRFYKHFQEPMFSRIMALLGEMDALAAEKDGMPLAQIALNWSARKDFVSTCLVGAQTRAKVEQNTAAFDRTLTDGDIARLDAAIEKYL